MLNSCNKINTANLIDTASNKTRKIETEKINRSPKALETETDIETEPSEEISEDQEHFDEDTELLFKLYAANRWDPFFWSMNVLASLGII